MHHCWANEVDEIRALAKPLQENRAMVNSTAVGGGVAEILNRLIPLAEELELDVHWDVMKGGRIFRGDKNFSQRSA